MAILGPKSCLGIDIGTRDIRVVEIRRAGGKLEIAQAARSATAEQTLRRVDAILAARDALEHSVAPLLAMEALMLNLADPG